MSTPDRTPDPVLAERARAGEGDYSLFGDAHVEAYEQSGGEVGYIWNGAPIAVLSTTGESSGKERKHALIFGFDGDAVVFVASKGGAPEHPQWYDNLVAEPHVKVQVLADRYDGVARTATGDERTRLWELMNVLWPSYEDYQAKTDREIPVVVVDRA
ncbi:nitroreductase family deazaflavin-dependent oxidoreductase [Aquihabitans sp. G128]|uniref:nitroreductase family deazaflavin-dependent oxidoreductase n=1 Tax=Aquihabitans sp. G128 TaxID=2849779 RepID=UPI001C226440|nr:nitroreductase family deazaflavin-dependent oxidoreductase [Aquihabitans sp. G128]QXC61121.1 nitroreductase family deazaflavin-dependent oxidoreductase [Aquihabitans sp. G128]